jgi:Na+-driven multidrug efflux pump
MIKDMTEGKPVRLMVGFGVPLIISNVLQFVFSIVDGTVVGRILGVMAFASVSATASSNWLLLSTILGIAQGFAVVFAHRFGAKDMPGFRRAFFTAMWLVAGFGILLGIAGAIWSRTLLVALGTPFEILDGAAVYLRVLTGGIIISFAYNILGAVLRALGDSKTPLYAMIFASLLNVALSIAFI